MNRFLITKTVECENNLHDNYSITASENAILQEFHCNKPRNRHHNNSKHVATTCFIRNCSIPIQFL